MAAAVIRNMNHGQNFHMLPNNCVIVSQASSTSPQSPPMHSNMHQNMFAYQQHQQYTQQQMTSLPSPQIQSHTMISPISQQTQSIQSQPPHHRLGKRLIAPAPTPSDRSSVDQSRVSSSKKSKMNYVHMPYGTQQPASVQRRNARERNRVKQVNNGFANLRQHIPSDVITALSHGGRGASKKLSKVDTLKLAVEYIRRLQDMLDENDTDLSSSSSRLSQGSTGSYYSPSPMQCTSIPPPPCSESSSSPTPSYTSDNSSTGNATYNPPTTYKFEPFDAYAPEDEELLDCISWWQSQ